MYRLRPAAASGEGSLWVTVWGKTKSLQDFDDWHREKLAMVIHGLDALVARLSQSGQMHVRLEGLSDISFYGVLSDRFEGGQSFSQIAERREINPALLPMIFSIIGDILNDRETTYSYRQEVTWTPLVELKSLPEDQLKIDIKNLGLSTGALVTLSPTGGDTSNDQYKIPLGSLTAASALSDTLQRLYSSEVVISSLADLINNRESLIFVPIKFIATIIATRHSGEEPGPYKAKVGLDMWYDTVDFSMLEAEAAQLKVEWMTTDGKFLPRRHFMNLASFRP